MIAPDDFDRLAAYLDDALADSDRLALETRLKTEPELARELVRLSRQEAILREWAGAMQLADPGPAPELTPSNRWIAWVAVLAAGVLLALGVFWPHREPGSIPEPNPIPLLARLHEAVGQVKVLQPSGESRAVLGDRALFGTTTVQIGG